MREKSFCRGQKVFEVWKFYSGSFELLWNCRVAQNKLLTPLEPLKSLLQQEKFRNIYSQTQTFLVTMQSIL